MEHDTIPPPKEEPPLRDSPVQPEDILRGRLTTLIDRALNHMLQAGHIEPSMMALIGNATATLAALDARKQSKVEC